MRWPRKGILIRLAIYLPIMGYLAYSAVGKWRSEREVNETDVVAPADGKAGDPLEPYKRIIEMPDGTKQEIIELTPEQAEQFLGHPVPDPKAEADPRTPAAD